jgi:hypothetical protein
VKCDDIVNSTQCINDVFTLIGKKCVLVEPEEPICRDVVKGCENNNINSKISCESTGAVINNDNTPLECMWLEENSTSESTVSGRCKLKVLFVMLIIFFFFFFTSLFFFLD